MQEKAERKRTVKAVRFRIQAQYHFKESEMQDVARKSGKAGGESLLGRLLALLRLSAASRLEDRQSRRSSFRNDGKEKHSRGAGWIHCTVCGLYRPATKSCRKRHG